MSRRRDNVLLSVGLLAVLLVAVVLVLSLMGSSVLLPQAGAGILLVGALIAFLLLQVWIFKLLGLRSRADEQPPAEHADDDADWRAWRG